MYDVNDCDVDDDKDDEDDADNRVTDSSPIPLPLNTLMLARVLSSKRVDEDRASPRKAGGGR